MILSCKSMKHCGHSLAVGVLLLLGLFLVAGTAVAQQCPAIRLVCTRRTPDNSAPLHCSVHLEGSVESGNLIHQWSVTPQAPLKIIPGRPDEIEVDLKDYANQSLRVSAMLRGLPEDCDNEARFDSRPNEQPAPQVTPKDEPSLTGMCSESVNEGAAAYFSVNVNDPEAKVAPIYNWTVSHGKIKDGQGTASIAVDTSDLGGGLIKATVQVGGFNPALRVSCTTAVKQTPKAYQLEEIKNKSLEEEREHLRLLALRLKIGLDEQAYIIAVGRQQESIEKIRSRAEATRDYLINQCGVAPNRIMGISAAFGPDDALQLWVVQAGAAPPQGQLKDRLSNIR